VVVRAVMLSARPAPTAGSEARAAPPTAGDTPGSGRSAAAASPLAAALVVSQMFVHVPSLSTV
jgi:hypothetical protein